MMASSLCVLEGIIVRKAPLPIPPRATGLSSFDDSLGRTMEEYSEVFLGLDVAKDRHAVALAESGRTGEVRYVGEISSDSASVRRLVRKLGRPGVRLRFCYEAGPTGLWRGQPTIVRRPGNFIFRWSRECIGAKKGRGSGRRWMNRSGPMVMSSFTARRRIR